MKSLLSILQTIQRIAAWLLLVIILLFTISGYGLTKGIINYHLASDLHLRWLLVVGAFAFIIHTFWAIHLALKRHRIWNRWTKYLLVIIYLLVFSAFTYIHFFYKSAVVSNTVATNENLQDQTNNQINKTSIDLGAENANKQEIKFNKEQLSKFNGLNGQPAYVAIDGLVYDLSSVFRKGEHAGYKAGLDQTQAFYSKHQSQILSRFKIVGKYNP